VGGEEEEGERGEEEGEEEGGREGGGVEVATGVWLGW